MTHQHESTVAGEANLGPGVAPSFGDVPGQPFEHTPERIVLSSEEHTRLSTPQFEAFGGEFAHEHLGRGRVSLRETDEPGEVHILASVVKQDGPALEIEADVRVSWLSRAARSGAGEPPSVGIVRELVKLAGLPKQSTVRVRTPG